MMPKKIYLLVLCLAYLGNVFAQGNIRSGNQSLSNSFSEPQEIKEPQRSVNTEIYYQTQSNFWSKNAIQAPQDAQSWFNYYKAERFSNFTDGDKNITEPEQQKLDGIVNEMEKYIPASFEYNFAKYLNGNYNTSLFGYLQKAYEIDPERSEIYDDFIAYYEITDNPLKKTEFCSKLQASNIIPNYVYDYNYNVLMGLDKNAILITNGYDDTYPIWILQNIQGIRTDVRVLNIDLLENETYRIKILDQLGLKTNVVSAYKFYKNEFFANLGQLNSDKNIYFALTVNQNILKSLQAQLYLTGLAFKFSNQGFDNLKILEDYWNKKVDKERISMTNNPEQSSDPNFKTLNTNYILPLMLLENYYYEQGKYDKANEIYEEAYKRARMIGKENMIMKRRARAVPTY